MFCKNCGKEISDNAVVCPYCGVQLADIKPNAQQETCTLAIVGLVLSIFMSLVGLIVSIIARKKCREENLKGGELALAGEIIGGVAVALEALSIIVTLIAMIFMPGLFAAIMAGFFA